MNRAQAQATIDRTAGLAPGTTARQTVFKPPASYSYGQARAAWVRHVYGAAATRQGANA